jgi:hypothetical protein
MDASLPIWPQHEAFYIESMLFHTRQVCTSMEHTAALVSEIDHQLAAGTMPSFDCSAALDHVQSVVQSAAALSRYFWPVRKAHLPRGAYLQKALKIADDSPLRDRSLRDAAEHFDERLDNHLSGGIAGVIMPEWFGPTYNADIQAHFFRAYFIDSGRFRILEDEFQIQPLSNELVRLHNRLVFCMNNGGRFPQVGA